MHRKLKNASFAALLTFTLGLLPSSQADDTDIYLKPNVPTGAEPLVMFILDWRPNLGASVSCPDDNGGCDKLLEGGYIRDVNNNVKARTDVVFFDIIRGAFMRVLDPLGGVKIGFMLNHDHTNNCEGPPEGTNPAQECSNGAYVLQGFVSMEQGTDDDNIFDRSGEDPDKLTLFDKLIKIPTPSGNLSHPFQGKELYFEFFRYLTGQGVYNGHNGFVDFGDSPNDSTNLIDETTAKGGDSAWDLNAEKPLVANTLPEYISPFIGATQCTKTFAVNLLFQVSQQEDDSDDAILVQNADGMDGINLSGNNNSFDTVLRYMKDVDLADGTVGDAPDIAGTQNVISYFVARDQALQGTTVPGYAISGGTPAVIPLSEDPDELIAALDNILNNILSVSTTFVAPSVPVNVFNRAQTLNEIFLALFEAEENGLPTWPGNLKKVVIGTNAIDPDLLELQDALNQPAIDTSGRLALNALTFYTDAGDLLPPVDNESAVGADGPAVTRGGVGQRIPGYVAARDGVTDLPLVNTGTNARQLFYENSADATDGLTPLNADVTTATALWTELTAKWLTSPSATTYAGAVANAEREQAQLDLRWARGLQATSFADTSTIRPWLVGDPLHSRPRPINYGARSPYTTANPDIRILFGTNDGFMHLIRNTTSAGVQSGVEDWAIITREALPLLDRLRLNTSGIDPTHPLTIDGSPSVLQKDLLFDGTIDGSDTVHAVFGLRRGGKCYNGIELTDPNAPKFLWKKCKTDAGFGELGQTWSQPVFGKVAIADVNGDSVINVLDAIDVAIFGAGYNGDDEGDNTGDLGKDAANRNGSTGTDDDEGRGVFIVNALTGDLVWKAVNGASTAFVSADKAYTHIDMDDSIPSGVGAADTDGNGLTDRLYVGDTGGVLWRMDIEGSTIANWTATPVVSVGRHFSGSAVDDRRFFNRPDIVQTRDDSSPANFDAVLIGTGDRENPLGRASKTTFTSLRIAISPVEHRRLR